MKVLVLGLRENSLDYLAYAREHGYAVQFIVPPNLTLDDKENWQRHVVASVNEAVDLSAVDEVISFHDAYQVQLELLRAELGLPCRNIDSLLCLADKARFKAHPAVRDHIARYIKIPPSSKPAEAEDAVAGSLGFPVVLKPSNGFYSAGVVKVSGPADFATAFAQTRRVCSVLRTSNGHSTMLAEEYIDGPEYAIDGMVSRNRLLPLLLHRKLPPLVGPYFHETAYVTEPFEAELGQGFMRILGDILTGIGLDDSPFHAEFRADALGRLHILEVAPRLCGGGSTTYQLSRICCGLDAYGILHKLAREEIELRPACRRVGLEFDAPVRQSGFLTGMSGTVEACKRHGATSVVTYKEDGDFVLAPPLNFETVLTAYFACDTRAAAEKLLTVLLDDCTIETRLEEQR